MKFTPAYRESRPQSGDDLAFVFSGLNMLVIDDTVPGVSAVSALLDENGLTAADGMFFGETAGRACYAYELPAGSENGIKAGGAVFTLLRRYVGELSPEVNSAAGYASHLLHWHNHSRFCGRCGAENRWYESECAKKCPACGNVQFPKISPAIIIMVRRGSEILLAHNKNFPEGRYSLLAGFMEMGETIEETAAREVYEEVGIEIGNVRYLSSQSWPFPDSLMLGLEADYESGEITPDGKEIINCRLVSSGELPVDTGTRHNSEKNN